MAKRTRLVFSPEDLHILSTQRYQHPHPRVQQRFEVLWLLSQGETQIRTAQLAGVSLATVERYVALYRCGGLDALREFLWVKPVSVLETYRSSLEEAFREQPPHTVAEACQRIEELTGVRRGETQVRRFLKKVLA